MKKIILAIFLVAITSLCCSGFSQVPNNYSFFKLYVKNQKNEVLLVEYDNEWEVPGKRYRGSSSVKEFVKLMAKNHGIDVKNIKLRALVTFHYNTKPNPTLMHYYIAEYNSGELKIPLGCSDIKWFSKKEAFSTIPYEEMNQILNHIEKDTSTLWGGAYFIKRKTSSTPRGSTIKEKLHAL